MTAKYAAIIPQSELKKIKKEMFFKPKDVAAMKQEARRHLRFIIGE